MKTRMFISLIVFATTAVIPMAAQSTKTPQTKLQPTKAVAAPPESPEHRFARSQYETAKHEFEESKRDYNARLQQDADRCKVFPEMIRHPVTISSVDNYVIGCKYETTKARYIMDKVGEAVTQIEVPLNDADDCLKIYQTTIDKNQSDQTTREVGQIKACQAEDLYPPRTK